MSVNLLCNILTNYLFRKLGKTCDIGQSSHTPEIVYPARNFKYQRSYYLENQFNKIEKMAFKSELSKDIKKLTGEIIQLGPILHFEIEDAFVTPKYIYSKQYRKIFSTTGRNSPLMPCSEVKHGIVVSSFHGCNYFGHWLRDDCATYLLAKEYEGTFCHMETPQWTDKIYYAKIFNQEWSTTDPVYCNKLSFFIDHGQNPNKAKRFRKLRKHIRNGNSPSDKPKIVYIKRGPTAKHRKLINEDILIEHLVKLGVYIHHAESDLNNLTKDCLDAKIIISVEGSQLSHGLTLLKDKGGLLVIQPPDRFFNSHLDWAQQLDMKYAFVVGDQADGGFSINIEEFDRTLELLDNAINA
jgi:hypothetical protein